MRTVSWARPKGAAASDTATATTSRSDFMDSSLGCVRAGGSYTTMRRSYINASARATRSRVVRRARCGARALHRGRHRHHVVAQRVEVTAHLGAGRGFVHREDRGEDTLVLGHRERHQAGMERRFAAVRLQAIRELRRLRAKVRIVRGVVDA